MTCDTSANGSTCSRAARVKGTREAGACCCERCAVGATVVAGMVGALLVDVGHGLADGVTGPMGGERAPEEPEDHEIRRDGEELDRRDVHVHGRLLVVAEGGTPLPSAE